MTRGADMMVRDHILDAGGRSVRCASAVVRHCWTPTRRARATTSSIVIASALVFGFGAVVQAKELSRSEVEAISRSEARREIQRREVTGSNVPTDVMQVGPQGRPTTVNGNGTTVTRNR